MHKIELEKKPYNILNLIFNSILSLLSLPLMTYLTTQKIYLAILLKKAYYRKISKAENGN